MPSGAKTLIEISKTMPEGMDKGIIETYALAYHPLMAMPMQSAIGGIFKWNIEDTLPHTTGFTRAVNADFTATFGKKQPFNATAKIYGGKVQIDRYLAAVDPSQVAYDRIGQVKAKAYGATKDIFEGAGGNSMLGANHYFDNVEIFNTQTVNAGTASIGAVVTTDMMDELISKVNVVPGRTYIYTTDAVERRLMKLSRGANVSGDTSYQMRYSKNEWGYWQGDYAGIPIISLKDGKGANLLSATQGDGSSSTVYCITYGDEMFTGFQLGGNVALDLKDGTNYNYFVIEHYMGVAPCAIRCMARLRYVSDAIA